MEKKLTFKQWLQEVWGIDWYDWDENYNPGDGQGKEIVEEYDDYLAGR